MKSYECKIFMGSVRDGSQGLPFSEEALIHEIKYRQSIEMDAKIVVRLTKTKYIFLQYEEEGWEISAIQYPRFPYPTYTIRNCMLRLAQHLKNVFEQKSVCVMDHEKVTYFGEEGDEHSSG